MDEYIDHVFHTSNGYYDEYSSEVAFYSDCQIEERYSEDVNIVCARLSKKWVEEVQFKSSLDEIVLNQHYQSIIRLGRSAIPFIIDDLRAEPKPWFFALRKITGENPIKPGHAGNFKAMSQAWLEWAEERVLRYNVSSV